jgi:hypothetical protein
LDNDERFEIKDIEYRERCASLPLLPLRRQHLIGAPYRVIIVVSPEVKKNENKECWIVKPGSSLGQKKKVTKK